MTTAYFTGLHTVEAIKAAYRTLAMQHHPDKGGDEETMKEINRQYHEALKACNGKQTEGKEYRYMQEVEQELMDKLLELLRLRGLHIALIGYWIWVSGDTKTNREALKAAGLQWHSGRQHWYYKPKHWRKSRRSQGNLAELARKYGYREFETGEKENIPATGRY